MDHRVCCVVDCSTHKECLSSIWSCIGTMVHKLSHKPVHYS